MHDHHDVPTARQLDEVLLRGRREPLRSTRLLVRRSREGEAEGGGQLFQISLSKSAETRAWKSWGSETTKPSPSEPPPAARAVRSASGRCGSLKMLPSNTIPDPLAPVPRSLLALLRAWSSVVLRPRQASRSSAT